MPRPSLKKERRAQILEAFETCVARYGAEASTLEKVAEEAGLARALIRHNVGNRDDLMEALLQRFLDRSDAAVAAMVGALPADRRVKTLVDWLFDASYVDTQLVQLSQALIVAGAEDESVARMMRHWTADFVETIAGVIRLDYPGTKKAKISAVSAGVTGIYFNVQSMAPLGGMSDLLKMSKRAAFLLIASLDEP
ncbi:MAG: TetR/AcrR family transcriptional regulator [Pseudomonadota bacterium]